MAKGFTVKEKAAMKKKKESDWDYEKEKEIVVSLQYYLEEFL